jgi:hypothetical protein
MTLTVYVAFFLGMSLIGLIAALKVKRPISTTGNAIANIQTQRNATLITIFAIHILLDSILLLIPRILFLRFSTSLPSMICSNSKYPDMTEGMNSMADESRVTQIENHLKQFSSPAWSQGSCMVWMWGLEVALVTLMILHMGAQALLGVRLLGYANYLGRQKRLERVVVRELC